MGRKLYKNKYLVGSHRLSGWDYSSDGKYFITICANKKGNIFGKIVNEKLEPNVIGVMADKYIREIPDHFPKTKIHAWIVMPDHVHFLIEVNERFVEPRDRVALQETKHRVEPHHGVALQQELKRPSKGLFQLLLINIRQP